MKKVFTIIMFLFLSALFVNAGEIKVTWYGHSCFLIEATDGTTLLTDPISMGAYKVPAAVKPDIVTVTHEHRDHNQVGSVSGNPIVLRGLKDGGEAYADIKKEVKGIKIYTVGSYHDKVKGEKRGLNAIFVYEMDGLRLVHLGDLGHCLTQESIKKIGDVDVLMIPVGGKYTICGDDADKVVSQLRPKVAVIPMHCKTDAADFLPYSAADFVKGKKNVVKISGNVYKIDPDNPPKTTQYVLMDYK